ncbi:probable proteasome maturation protein [Coccomyxa sp. Obi]|nr:probable proteasome maturation protein [Coccomyxa sp. Obi]
MEEQKALPHMVHPHDTLRLGLGSLKDQASVVHPVEAIQKSYPKNQVELKLGMLRNLYGSALPARMQLDRQILSKAGRLPGMPSSHLGLQSLTGELDDFCFESYVGFAEDSETPGPDMHSLMEAKHKMGLPPVTRSIL